MPREMLSLFLIGTLLLLAVGCGEVDDPSAPSEPDR